MNCPIFGGQFITESLFNGDPNAMNFELWLTKEYYQATMETYQLAKVFLENNRDYQSLIHLIN